MGTPALGWLVGWFVRSLTFCQWLKWLAGAPFIVAQCTYLQYKPSYSQFSDQITATGYHGNKGRSEVNLEDTIRLPDPENPQFGANSVHVSSKMLELWLLEVAIGRNAIFHIFV